VAEHRFSYAGDMSDSCPRTFDRTHTADLTAFVQASPTPYHVVANVADRLAKAGFRQVAETDSWEGGTGGRYVLRGGAIVAWYVPAGARPHTPYRVVGAHTDSPNLRVKPRPDLGSAGWRQVAVEIYGGPLVNSWLDRDLGLAGRLSLRDGTHRLVNVDRPLLRVAQLAIHLDRGVNDNGLTLDKQRHLQPLWGLGEVDDGGAGEGVVAGRDHYSDDERVESQTFFCHAVGRATEREHHVVERPGVLVEHRFGPEHAAEFWGRKRRRGVALDSTSTSAKMHVPHRWYLSGESF